MRSSVFQYSVYQRRTQNLMSSEIFLGLDRCTSFSEVVNWMNGKVKAPVEPTTWEAPKSMEYRNVCWVLSVCISF